jgi:hypothetical protein
MAPPHGDTIVQAARGPTESQGTASQLGFATPDDTKTAITATDILNDRVLPPFEKHEISVSRVLFVPRPPIDPQDVRSNQGS